MENPIIALTKPIFIFCVVWFLIWTGSVYQKFKDNNKQKLNYPADIKLQFNQAIRDVIDERVRQFIEEGFTPEMDDNELDGGDLACKAAAYTMNGVSQLYNRRNIDDPTIYGWPPDLMDTWKPKDPRFDLVRAGALIIAEIERFDRHVEKYIDRRNRRSD